MLKYKTIEIKLTKPLSDREIAMLTDFNVGLKQQRMKIEFDNQRIWLLLREIDLDRLRDLHHQLAASYELPLTSNPVALVLQKIESIKSYGIRSGRRLYVDYNKERKVVNRTGKEAKRGQFFYALDHNFNRDIHELPKSYLNKIICGDSESVLKNLPDNCVDLVFTSPPYNFGLAYQQSADDQFWQHYFEKLFRIFDECIRVLKFGGRIVVNVQPLFSDYIPSHHIISNFFIQRKLIWKGEILWEKNNYNCKYTAWGSWQSPSNPYLKYTWEFLEIFCKGEIKKPGQRQDIDISADDFKKWVTAKWSISPERKMKAYDHPAMFPEELVKRVLQLFSYQNDVILDPFNGVGTTSYVASRLNRRYLGIDISDEYCQRAAERILQNC